MKPTHALLAAICSTTLLLGASSASAGGDSGFYVGASVGQASFSVDTIDTDNFDFDDDDNAYKVMLGYNFGWLPFLDVAVEGAYRNLGEFEGSGLLSGVSSEIDTIDLFGMLTANMGPVGLFAKVGYVDWDIETDVQDSNFSTSGSDAAYGIGAQARIASFAVRGEYEVFEIEGADDLEMLSVGLTYTF